MKTTLTVLVVIAAVALIWILVLDPRERVSPAPPSAAREEVRATSSQVVPVEEARELAEARTSRTVIAEGSADQAATTRLEPGAAGNLVVLVAAEESGAPLPDVGLIVQVMGGQERIEADWVGAMEGEDSPRTDEQGCARFVVPPDAHVAIVASWSGARSTRQVQPLASGEERTVRLELPTRREARFVGRVVDEESGEPIAGAQVSLPTHTPRIGPDEPRTSPPEAEELQTDPDGWFEITATLRRREEGQVNAKGYGPIVFRPDGIHPDRERALVVRLRRGATLRGRIEGASDPSELVVLAQAHGFEFSVGAGVGGLDGLDRRAPVGQDGTWVLADLPPRAGLRLELFRAETRLRKEPHMLFLEPGEERHLTWTLGGGSTLHGRAVIADTDAPLPGRSIWLVPATEVLGRLTPHHEPVARSTTDDEGSFTFTDVSPGEWAVGPAPQRMRRDPREDGGDGIAPMTTRVSILDVDQMVEVELRLHRGLFISGEVLDPDGERTPSCTVYGYNEAVGMRDLASVTDGTFRLGPLVPGSYDLSARGGVGTSASEKVTAKAGDTGVVLQLNAGGTIQGRLIDPASGEAVQGRISLTREDRFGGVSTRTRPDGRFSLGGLSYGSYTATGSSGDLAGHVKGVAIGPLQSVADVEVPLEAGAILLIKYTGAQAFANHSVIANGFPWGMGRYERGQTSRTVRVPGEIVVSVTYETPDGQSHTVERTANLVAGEETEVEVGDE